MKKLLLAILVLAFGLVKAQEGTIEHFTIQSQALQNTGGENTLRSVSVYLPPGYATNTNKSYPVIYYLHGFMGTDAISPQMKSVLDQGIQSLKIRPFIFVQSNQFTLFEGSFYTNSSLTGNWETFTCQELVDYIDQHYRTIAKRTSRGIAGHSMGGYGAFSIGMHHPEVFSSIYALSPGLLAMVKEFGPNSSSFKDLQKIKTVEELKTTYYPKVLVAVGRAWSPNINNPPFYCDMPFTYKDDQLVINQEVLKKWEDNMPVYSVEKFASNLRQMKAIKLDWGRNDAPRFPVQIGMLSQKLESLGIAHFAEEYIGDHTNKIWTRDGRVLNDLLPFFNDYLNFD